MDTCFLRKLMLTDTHRRARGSARRGGYYPPLPPPYAHVWSHTHTLYEGGSFFLGTEHLLIDPSARPLDI